MLEVELENDYDGYGDCECDDHDDYDDSDVLDYEGDGAVVISWVEMTFKNKKSGNIGTILQHIQHSFNEEGEIVREDYYFNPAQLPQ